MKSFLTQFKIDLKVLTKEEFINKYLYIAQTAGEGSTLYKIPVEYCKQFGYPAPISDSDIECMSKFYDFLKGEYNG